jgi:hypothetical protein
MTNEELIARLRDWPYQGETMAVEAADRIEALTAELAKAVEGLRSIAANTCCTPCQEAALVARTTLAEIEGEKG